MADGYQRVFRRGVFSPRSNRTRINTDDELWHDFELMSSFTAPHEPGHVERLGGAGVDGGSPW